MDMTTRVFCASVLTSAAGFVHAAATVTHAEDAVLLAVAFAVCGWAQVLTALWVAASPSQSALAAMTFVNVSALAAWVASRTVGIPVLQPDVETAGLADLLTVLLENLAVAVALYAPRAGAGTTSRRMVRLATWAAIGLLASGASGTAVTALATGQDGGAAGHGEASRTTSCDCPVDDPAGNPLTYSSTRTTR